MEIEIKFESDDFFSNDLCNEMTITVNVYSNDGSDIDWELVSIYDNTSDQFRKLMQFSEDEQNRIEQLCRQAADDNAYDVISSYSEREYNKDDDNETW
jgi:hypothetical protein